MVITVVDREHPTTRAKLHEAANNNFFILVKAVVDIKQEIMAIGGELHADEEVWLSEHYDSTREFTWGINLYPEKSGDAFIEFDSMINLKPQFNNRSRDIESQEIRKQIVAIVSKLIPS